MIRVEKLFWGTIARVFVVILLTAILLLPTAVTAMSEEQRRIFDLGIPYYDVDEVEDEGVIDPCAEYNGSGNNANITPGGCAKLASLRTAMWNSASDKDKKRFMHVVEKEDYGLMAVEAYMNQVISKYQSGYTGKNDGTLGGWLNGYCVLFMENGATKCATEKQGGITAQDQKLIDMALGGSNVAQFAVGNATGGSNTGAGKIVCIWKRDPSKPEVGYCRDDVDLTKSGGIGKCNVYSPSADFGECWGLESNSSWATNMKATCAVTSSNPGSGGLPNEANAEVIYKFLTGKGFTAVQASAIMGVWYGESDFNPTATEPSSGAYGLAQWLGSRKTALFAKPNHNTLETQLNFFLEELNGSYKNRALTSKANAQPDVPTDAKKKLPDNTGQKFWDSFKSTSDMGAAVVFFFDAYECGLSSSSCSKQFHYNDTWKNAGGRLGMAWRVYNHFKNRSDISVPGSNSANLDDYDYNDDDDSTMEDCVPGNYDDDDTPDVDNLTDGLPFNLTEQPEIWTTVCFGKVSGVHVDGHGGIDFHMPSGTKLYSTIDGKVRSVGWQSGDSSWSKKVIDGKTYTTRGVGWGYNIKIEISGGKTVVYAHMEGGSAAVSAGQTVHKGQYLGKSDNTGRSIAAHLHFEVNKTADYQRKVNPIPYMGPLPPKVNKLNCTK
ncbi:phage tail tip lysozyme [Candidatus Saccharibacteria bacterium]|nr:phage tail tip lysozyme [Candidatus Saccharibacteria bacterium]MCL1963164.1 phage tail tip lysozyme [Candidatus Saccharibacteria bacterium]